ncbi:ATP/GTP-binding protein [Streptomyces sp. NPDC089799]|uniref:ATP/GTP-binding protein n=1 Tax=Streptomyces sp. NPDC089799 TaxID=3155066 RepID=UPI003412F767
MAAAPQAAVPPPPDRFAPPAPAAPPTTVPPPAGPPTAPPPPARRPDGRTSFTDWLRTPRRSDGPGVWAYGHVPRPDTAPDEAPARTMLSGAVISLLACVLVWSLLRRGYIPYWTVPVKLFTPADWWDRLGGGPVAGTGGDAALAIYELLLVAGLLYGFGKLGAWPETWRRLAAPRTGVRVALAAAGALLTVALVAENALPLGRVVYALLPYDHEHNDPATLAANAEMVDTADLLIRLAVLIPFGWLALGRSVRRRPATAADGGAAAVAPAPGGPEDPADWPELRAAGLPEAADRLRAEAADGRMNDVDAARIRRAWDTVTADPGRRTVFTDAVRSRGAGACVHPSGARDLPVRTARHDLLARQVRLGTVTDLDRNPYPRRGTGLALDPTVLGTSMVAVGPSGAGKTRRLVRPVVESLSLQALAGRAAVVAVCPAGTPLGPDEAYDVVIRIGDPATVHDLDLYGGTTDPDEAAGLLAEALAGDQPGTDVRRAATALAQLLGPFRTAYGRFPGVPELRELVDRAPAAEERLRAALETAGAHTMLRELDARTRQHGTPGDPGPLLSGRIALLDRPAFQGFFDTTGRQGRPFSLRTLEHPVRVRVELPERGHADASRMLARLLLAQFTAGATARTDRSLFAFLALDDATHTLTPETVRGLQRLRSANAGVLLALRTLDDVPEALRAPLLGVVGCRAAFAGVTTWDGQRFAEAWGTEWVETRTVTHRTVYADQPLTRMVNSFRKLVTGKAVTTDAVTVRQEERERWSASDLAHAVPAGHAVLSVTSVGGERSAPLLVDLDG